MLKTRDRSGTRDISWILEPMVLDFRLRWHIDGRHRATRCETKMKRSPVFSMEEDIVRAPFDAAPEKAHRLHGKVSRLEVVFLDGAGEFIFA